MRITKDNLDFSKSVVLLITQWNRYKMTQSCIDSIRKYTDLSDVSILILDDNSDCPEAQAWIDSTPESVLASPVNCHHNALIRQMQEIYKDHSEVKYLVAMNSDIVVTKNWLKNMIQCMEENPNTALMGCKDNNDFHCYQYFYVPEQFYPSCNGDWSFGDDSKLQEYIDKEFYAKRKSNAVMNVATIDGSIMLFRNSLLNEIGTFNKDFDDYAADSEFFFRVIEKKYSISYCLSSFVYHRSGGGAGKYEGYLKTFGKPLAEAADTAMEKLKAMYQKDIRNHGRSYTVPKEQIAAQEAGLVGL